MSSEVRARHLGGAGHRGVFRVADQPPDFALRFTGFRTLIDVVSSIDVLAKSDREACVEPGRSPGVSWPAMGNAGHPVIAGRGDRRNGATHRMLCECWVARLRGR